MKKILLLVPQNVIPATDGGKTGIYMPMVLLAKNNNVKAIVFAGADENFAAEEYRKIGVEPIYAPTNKRERAVSIFLNLFSFLPFKFSKYYVKEHAALIAKTISSWQPDVVICHHAHLAAYCKKLKRMFPSLQIILREHNVEYLLVQQYYKHQQNPVIKLFAYWQYHKTRRFEKKCWDYFTDVAFISDSDFKYFNNTPHTRAFILYDGMTKQAEAIDAHKKSNAFLFSGSLGSYQNKINLLHFIKNIWLPWKNDPDTANDYELWITGDKSTDFVLEALQLTTNDAAKYQIKPLGYVDDLAVAIQKARFFLSPTLIGAGIRIKVLEALGLSSVIFLTDKDIEMCNLLKNNETVVLFNNLPSFNSQFKHVINNNGLYMHIATNAGLLARQNFTWDIFNKKLNLILNNNG